MKLKLIGLALLVAALVHGQSVSLAWDPSPSPEVTHYKMYCWYTPGAVPNTDAQVITNPPTRTVMVGNVTNLVVSNLLVGTWSFAVSALASNATETLESDLSNVVATPVQPVKPKRLWRR